MKSIDTTIQGYSTYQQILDWGIDFPYSNTVNYVATRKSNPHNNGHVTFIGKDLVEVVKSLKMESGKHIWLIGGSELNATFLNAGLVDELIVYHMPIYLPKGIPLFTGLANNHLLPKPEVKTYASGAVELRYTLKKEI